MLYFVLYSSTSHRYSNIVRNLFAFKPLEVEHKHYKLKKFNSQTLSTLTCKPIAPCGNQMLTSTMQTTAFLCNLV